MGAGNLTASWDLCGLSHLAWTAWIPSRAEDGWVGCLSAFQGLWRPCCSGRFFGYFPRPWVNRQSCLTASWGRGLRRPSYLELVTMLPPGLSLCSWDHLSSLQSWACQAARDSCLAASTPDGCGLKKVLCSRSLSRRWYKMNWDL
jgi:hypothetical protein